MSATTCTAFGLLDYIADPTTFAVASFVLRIINGLSFAAYITAVFASVATLFKPQLGFVMVWAKILLTIIAVILILKIRLKKRKKLTTLLLYSIIKLGITI